MLCSGFKKYPNKPSSLAGELAKRSDEKKHCWLAKPFGHRIIYKYSGTALEKASFCSMDCEFTKLLTS